MIKQSAIAGTLCARGDERGVADPNCRCTGSFDSFQTPLRVTNRVLAAADRNERAAWQANDTA